MMFLLLQVSSPGQGFLSSVPVFSLSLSQDQEERLFCTKREEREETEKDAV